MKYWCRLGIWVGLAAGFYILVNEVLQKYAFYETWRWHVYKVLIGAGALLAIMAKRSKEAQAQPRPQGQGSITFRDDESDDDSSGRIFSQRYCGFILTTFGVIVRVVIPTEDVEMRVAARTEARQPVAEKEEEEEPAPKPRGPVTFPELKVQGVACSKSNPSAIINRKTYFVGDMIEGAKLATILADSIVLEKDGQKQVYLLTVGSRPGAQAQGRP